MFSRCAKSLLLSGPTDKTQGDRALGFTLELVAERNPYTMNAGQELPVRLTYENRPLAGALVVAMNRANPSQKLTARSGKDGRVRFRLPRGGVWMIKAVHMIEAPAGAKADWASYWASLTFELERIVKPLSRCGAGLYGPPTLAAMFIWLARMTPRSSTRTRSARPACRRSSMKVVTTSRS